MPLYGIWEFATKSTLHRQRWLATTAAPDYHRKCQGTPASIFSGWFSPLDGVGFTVMWHATHRSIRPPTSTPSASEPYIYAYLVHDNTIRAPHGTAPHNQESNVGGQNTHTLVGPSAACWSPLLPSVTTTWLVAASTLHPMAIYNRAKHNRPIRTYKYCTAVGIIVATVSPG